MTPSEQIDKKIAELNDWRGALFTSLRSLINETEPQLTENWKWSTAVWSLKNNVCAVGVFKNHVKLNFFKGAQIDDSYTLFNGGLDSKEHRSIDFAEDSLVDNEKIKMLIHEAVTHDA